MGSGARRTPGGGRSLAGRYGKVGVGESSPGLPRSAGLGFVSLYASARGNGCLVPAEWRSQGKGMDGGFRIGSL